MLRHLFFRYRVRLDGIPMGSKSRSRVKVSLAREECKQKVLNRSNVIVTEKYNTEEQILLESFRHFLGGRWEEV